MNAWESTAPRETSAAKSRDLDVVRAQRWAAFPKFGARKAGPTRVSLGARPWSPPTNPCALLRELRR